MSKVIFITDSLACGERQFNTLADAEWYAQRLLDKDAAISTSIIELDHSAHVSLYKLQWALY